MNFSIPFMSLVKLGSILSLVNVTEGSREICSRNQSIHLQANRLNDRR